MIIANIMLCETPSMLQITKSIGSVMMYNNSEFSKTTNRFCILQDSELFTSKATFSIRQCLAKVAGGGVFYFRWCSLQILELPTSRSTHGLLVFPEDSFLVLTLWYISH